MNVINRDGVAAVEGGPGEVVRELAGLGQGNAQRLSLAEVTIMPDGQSREHYHHELEEAYYLLTGQAHMTVDEEIRTVGPGDTIVIPPGARHRIVNTGDTDLVMIVVCAPAWHLEDNVFLD
jgi:mannose-6-phosphate isomerase-like protein (cupin superfamily)